MNIRDNIRDILFKEARGDYQHALLSGRRAWSGADLAGKAKTYGAKYHRSRGQLITRIDTTLRNHGWGAEYGWIVEGGRRRRGLVIHGPRSHYEWTGRRLKRLRQKDPLAAVTARLLGQPVPEPVYVV